MALKEQDVVFTTKDANGNTVIQMPITRVENVEGAVKTVNGAGPDNNGNVNVTEYVHPSSGVTAGTYNNVTVNAQGHVMAGSNTTFAKVATSGSYNDLSNKPTIPATPKAYVTETWSSGTSWYRKWSDGWIEQGGKITATGYQKVAITLTVAFSNTNYTVLIGESTTYLGYGAQNCNVFKETVTKTGFTLEQNDNYSGGSWWMACGR